MQREAGVSQGKDKPLVNEALERDSQEELRREAKDYWIVLNK